MLYKIVLFLLIISGFAYSQGGLWPSGVHCWHLNSDVFDCIQDSVEANLDTTRFATIDTVVIIVQDSIADIYPIPVDSLVDSTITVMADSGLGGGGTTTLGDTVNLQVYVDDVTIDIFQDTLRVDTSRIATHTWASDTALQIASDSSQYYYWRAKSGYIWPQFPNSVVWNLYDYKTAQDSAVVCYYKSSSTGKHYAQIIKSTSASDSQYVSISIPFVAPRDVSDITDTLLIIQYSTTDADTGKCSFKPHVYEGTTARYSPTDFVASTSVADIAILKNYGTLSSIVEGDEFTVELQAHVDADTVYIWRVEYRWR